MLAIVQVVMMFIWGEDNMMSCQEKGLIVIATFTEVQTTSSFKVGEGFQSNLDAK